MASALSSHQLLYLSWLLAFLAVVTCQEERRYDELDYPLLWNTGEAPPHIGYLPNLKQVNKRRQFNGNAIENERRLMDISDGPLWPLAFARSTQAGNRKNWLNTVGQIHNMFRQIDPNEQKNRRKFIFGNEEYFSPYWFKSQAKSTKTAKSAKSGRKSHKRGHY